MRILVLTVIGLILSSCHSKHLTREDSPDSDGNRFSITHQVEPRQFEHLEPEPSSVNYAYLKRRSKSKRTIQSKQMAQSEYTPTLHDGAPSGPLPVHFKKVKPKREPISRYGNPDAYQVKGKQYEVMTNSTGYKSRGIASWYGTKFHSVRTSSGEKYDMYALTAAHKTLPLPTYLRVKNLSNGRVAIVKVNDRGPFHDSRILDLSYAAAAKLGLFPKGTAPVEIEALKTTQHSLHYYVQAGAFDSSELAEQLRVKLGTLTTSPVDVQKHHHRYLVQVGPFATKDMITGLKQRLESNGVHGSFSMLM